MDMNEYTLEILVRARLAELRAEAERWNQFEVRRLLPSRPLRDAVGHALVLMGTRLFGVRKNSPSAVGS